MKNFSLELINDHPVIHSGDDIILIDTGSPTTICNQPKFEFLGSSYGVSHNLMGFTVEKLSEMIGGARITVLLGMDILSKYWMYIDYSAGEVAFSEYEISFSGETIPFSTFMGIPGIDIVIDQNPVKCFLDSGAQLSYLPERLTRNHSSTGKKDDFYPGFGKFSCQTFSIETKFQDESFQVNYGNLPELLGMSLLVAGVEGIIGYDFFNHYSLLFDFKSSILTYTVK